MIIKKLLFDIWYRFAKPPWMIDQAQPDLIATAEKGEIRGPTVLRLRSDRSRFFRQSH